jgi:PncC family amidohydrolase
VGIEEAIGRMLVSRELRVALAESCTGGLIGHRLTQVSGSSAFFLGGVVAYSNAAKQRLLGVDGATLEREGAVSEAVAEAMARGARRVFDADVALGVTGIAGPSGGTAGKPVGLVYIALADRNVVDARRYVFEGQRTEIKEAAASAALDRLVGFLQQ